MVVDASCHLMLDFVANADEKTQIPPHRFVKRAIAMIKALPQAQIPIRSVFGLFEAAPFPQLGESSVLNFLFMEVSMDQISPGDSRSHDEQLGFKFHMRIVENLHRSEHRLLCFLNQFCREGPYPTICHPVSVHPSLGSILCLQHDSIRSPNAVIVSCHGSSISRFVVGSAAPSHAADELFPSERSIGCRTSSCVWKSLHMAFRSPGGRKIQTLPPQRRST